MSSVNYFTVTSAQRGRISLVFFFFFSFVVVTRAFGIGRPPRDTGQPLVAALRLGHDGPTLAACYDEYSTHSHALQKVYTAWDGCTDGWTDVR